MSADGGTGEPSTDVLRVYTFLMLDCTTDRTFAGPRIRSGDPSAGFFRHASSRAANSLLGVGSRRRRYAAHRRNRRSGPERANPPQSHERSTLHKEHCMEQTKERRAVVIGVCDSGFLFSLVTPGIIELNGRGAASKEPGLPVLAPPPGKSPLSGGTPPGCDNRAKPGEHHGRDRGGPSEPAVPPRRGSRAAGALEETEILADREGAFVSAERTVTDAAGRPRRRARIRREGGQALISNSASGALSPTRSRPC